MSAELVALKTHSAPNLAQLALKKLQFLEAVLWLYLFIQAIRRGAYCLITL
jgi:hypothetical protein